MTGKMIIFICLPVLGLAAGLVFLTTCSGELPVREEKIEAGDVTLFVRTVGNPARAPVLLAINGGPGQSSHYMQSLERLAGPDLAVVTFDQRGCGRSTKGTGGYAFDRYIADMEVIRQYLGKDKMVLLGHSFGGVLALRYASRYPLRVSKLILMGSGPPARELVTEAQMRLGMRIQELTNAGVLSGNPPQEPAEMILYMLPAYFSDPAFPIPEEIRAASIHPEVGRRTLTESGDWDLRPEMGAIACPVLFLWGEDDPFGSEMADQTKGALQNAELTEVTIKNCGHFWQEQPGPFFKAIRDFLDM
jgi:proline iminopeptidase